MAGQHAVPHLQGMALAEGLSVRLRRSRFGRSCRRRGARYAAHVLPVWRVWGNWAGLLAAHGLTDRAAADPRPLRTAASRRRVLVPPPTTARRRPRQESVLILRCSPSLMPMTRSTTSAAISRAWQASSSTPVFRAASTSWECESRGTSWPTPVLPDVQRSARASETGGEAPRLRCDWPYSRLLTENFGGRRDQGRSRPAHRLRAARADGGRRVHGRRAGGALNAALANWPRNHVALVAVLATQPEGRREHGQVGGCVPTAATIARRLGGGSFPDAIQKVLLSRPGNELPACI